MQRIIDYKLKATQAGLWFLGQSGFIIKSDNKTIAIDPYLSDSVAKSSPRLTRSFSAPIEPQYLKVDMFIVTHDHMDHLDPETILPYQHKDSTVFVGPRFACQKLKSLNIPDKNIVKIDSGESKKILDVKITGVYAVANEPKVIDTCGYKIEFKNGRNIYHTSDTDLSPLLIDCAPKSEVMLVCINGKWGNMDVIKAAELTAKLKPQYVIPHHYDLMELNSENPDTFEYQMNYVSPEIKVRILKPMEPFVWPIV